MPLMAAAIKVVHVVPALFGDSGIYGGAERYAYELAKAMSRVVDTRLVAFGTHEAERTDGELQVVVLRNRGGPPNNPFNPRLLSQLLRADIVHVHQTNTVSASMAVVMGRMRGKPAAMKS